MKTILTLFLFMACCVSAIAATAVFPASTNGFNTFTGTNAFMNTVGIGTADPNHKLHVVSTTNDVVGIDSTGVDSASMLHIKNTGPQGPFFDFWASPGRYGYGVASGGNFNIRHSAVGVDPVNGTTIFTLDPVGNVSALAGFAGNGGVNATTIGLTNLTTTTNTIYVELTGNDLTGDGSYAHPYRTIMRVCSATNPATLNGITVKLGPGIFDYTGSDAFDCIQGATYDGVKVPQNGVLMGSGKNVTTLRVTNCFDYDVFVIMQDGGTLADMTVDIWHPDPANVFSAGISVGFLTAAQGLNLVYPTNFFMRNVRLYGVGDCWINTGTSTNASFWDCEFYTHFDGISLRGSGLAQNINFYNCTWFGDNRDGQTLMLGPQSALETGTWNIYGGSVTIQPAGAIEVKAVFSAGAAGQTFNVFGTHVNTPGLTNVFDSKQASTWNVSGGNLADCLTRNDFVGTLNVLPKKVGVPQTTLNAAWTNLVPKSAASITNWALVNTNGIPMLVATNYNNSPVGQAFFIKVLVP